MKVLLLALLPMLALSFTYFSANSFSGTATTTLEKSLASQALLRQVLHADSGTPSLVQYPGKTADGVDCMFSIDGVIPGEKPEYSVLLMDLKISATDANPEGAHLTFYIDSKSEPKILIQTPDEISVKQTDMQTRISSIEFNLGEHTVVEPYFEDFGVKDLLDVRFADGKPSKVFMANDKAQVTCELLP
jgi:hypothetical protein